MTTILGLKLIDRTQSAVCVQHLLTDFGCHIRTRIGLHKETEGQCAPDGIILLEMTNQEAALKLKDELSKINNAQIQLMVF